MFLLKPIIFKLFGNAEKVYDTYKNPSFDNKGIYERYNESVAEDFDDELIPLINDFVGNTMDPFTVLQKFIAYLEEMVGMNLVIYSEINRRRKYLSIINKMYDIKGTIPAYRIMLLWQGFENVYIIEHGSSSGFDSPEPFDSTSRTFDQACQNVCAEYSIQLEGSVVADPEIIDRIFKIIEFNEPINAVLRSLTLNGNFLAQDVISVYISDGTDGNEAGDLIYDNTNDPTLILRIADQSDVPTYEVGDLIVEGPNADKYTVNSSGDLIYTFGSFFFNNALKLNGVDELVTFPISTLYNFGVTPFQVVIWVKISSDTGSHPIISKYGPSAAFDFSVVSGRFQMVVFGPSGFNVVNTTNTFAEDTWYQVIFTVDTNDASNWKIHVNNVEENLNIVINTLGDITDLDFNEPIILGEGNGVYGDLTLDEFLMKGGIMSPTERSDLYAFGDGQDPVIAGVQDIVLRANFDEILGTQIFDQSGNDNHGTLTGPGDATNRVIH